MDSKEKYHIERVSWAAQLSNEALAVYQQMAVMMFVAVTNSGVEEAQCLLSD